MAILITWFLSDKARHKELYSFHCHFSFFIDDLHFFIPEEGEIAMFLDYASTDDTNLNKAACRTIRTVLDLKTPCSDAELIR